MFRKLLCCGIAVLAVAFSPMAAKATVYEAIWQVQLYGQYVNGETVEISRPTNFEYKVRFSNDLWYVDAHEDYPTETMTYFDRAPILHTRPATDYLPARPEGGTRMAYNNLYAYVVDDEYGFYESITSTEHEIIEDVDLYWKHSTYIQNQRTTEPRSGIGEDDYSMTSDGLLTYLEQVLSAPSAFRLTYLETVHINAGPYGDSLYWLQWQGDMQLVSLRALDATDVPEPPLMALVGAGLAGIGLVCRRQRRQAA